MSDRYWSDDSRKIYSDGSFEVLWGTYKRDKRKVLGVHWCNTNDTYACPKLYGGELGWLVVPYFLTASILNCLLLTVRANPKCGSSDEIVGVINEVATQEKMAK